MYPTTAAYWWNLVQLLAGGFIGWIFHPVIWLVAGPFRWSALLYMTAAQESGFNAANTSGDNGDSWGMVQFNVNSWPDLTGRALEDRLSPFLSGYYSARYVANGLYTSWSWWSLGLPIYGAAVMRYMWTHGISASSADKAGTEAYDIFVGEGKSYSAFLFSRSLTALPALGACFALFLLARKLAAKVRK